MNSTDVFLTIIYVIEIVGSIAVVMWVAVILIMSIWERGDE